MDRKVNIMGQINELQMAKKRDHKIAITDEAIKKVPRIEYKGIPEEEYDSLWELTKTVLKISKNQNNSNEVAITYSMNDTDMNDDEMNIGVSLGQEHSVDPLNDPISYHLVYSARDCIVIVLHNHPSLSDFSLLDVQFLLTYRAVKMMVVVTNLGNISYLVKNDHYDSLQAISLLNEAGTMNNEAQNLKDIRKAADYFLKNCYNVGITYENR